MEKDGSWTAVTAIAGVLGLNKVKKMMRMMIVMKIKKMVATMHEARFVLPDGGGDRFFRPPIRVLGQRGLCFSKKSNKTSTISHAFTFSHAMS